MSTYTPKVGDTVRWGASTQTFTVRTDVFNYHVAATEDDSEATMHLFHVDDLVKVEPTPNDLHVTIDGLGPIAIYKDRETALAIALTETQRCRVARFSFAEWVVPGE